MVVRLRSGKKKHTLINKKKKNTIFHGKKVKGENCPFV